MRRVLLAAIAAITVATVGACGDGYKPPTQPPIVNPPTNNDPPVNSKPTIDSIAVQGRRAKQPANFADVRETIDVTATVRDPETALEELIYQWSATVGTFTGTGRAVTWTAPETASQPTTVTITLKVIENYGHPGQAKTFSQDVTSTTTLALHDSAKEVGEISRQFLLDFSDTNVKDWQYVMRNFSAAACPDPREVDSEKNDVVRNYTEYDMKAFTIGTPKVTVNFGGFCEFRGKQGDACAVVPAFWDSLHKPSGSRSTSNGDDIIAAVYSVKDSRWWLCASDYRSVTTLAPTHIFYGR